MRSSHAECEPWSGLVNELSSLTQADVAAWSDQQVRDGLLALLPAVNQLVAMASTVAGSFEVRELAPVDGFGAARSWLIGMGRMSQGAATGWLRRGRLLRDLPALAAGALAGKLGAEHVSKVADLVAQVGVEKVAPLAEVLTDLGAEVQPVDFQQACERVRAWADPDGPEPDPDAGRRRALTISRSGSLFSLRGLLDLDGGATLITALDALMKPPAAGDERSAAQRRADALVELARQPLVEGQLPTVGGMRPQLGLLVTPETLLGTGDPGSGGLSIGGDGAGGPGSGSLAVGGHDDAGPLAGRGARSHEDGRDPDDTARCGDALSRAGVPPGPEPPWLEWAGHIPVAVAQRIACDCEVWRAILDPATGLPLEVGRAHRIVPRWIRKALHARDRGCRWPGCRAATAWTEAHHLIEWYYGGETNIDNLLLLCRWHHGRVHEGQWRIRLDARTGEVSVTRPDGRPYELGPSQPWRPRHPDADAGGWREPRKAA